MNDSACENDCFFLHDRELRHYGAKLESNMPNGGFHSLKLVI